MEILILNMAPPSSLKRSVTWWYVTWWYVPIRFSCQVTSYHSNLSLMGPRADHTKGHSLGEPQHSLAEGIHGLCNQTGL